MKKIIIVIIIALLLITIGLIFIFTGSNNIASTITLDINPSIEINLDKDNNIVNIIPLNDDAKDIVNDELNGKSLDVALNIITNNVIENGYVEENELTILIHSDGIIKNEELIYKIDSSFGEKNVHTNIIAIDNISSEDKELAKKYNISPAKAAYINSISNENIDGEELIDKPVDELSETKNTGNYCDDGYKLEGSWCYKEISRVAPLNGNICPNGYYEYKGKCYEEKPIEDTGNLICDEGILEDGKCRTERTYDAKPVASCSTGELGLKSDIGLTNRGAGNDEYICIDKSSGQAPVLRCLKNPGHIMIGGKCYNGPAPTINGGCPNGDSLVKGKCYSKDNEDQWVCPNGKIYHKSQNSVPEKCPDTIKYTKAVIDHYECENNDEIRDKKCIVYEEHDPFMERKCPNEFTLVNNDRCINLDNVVNKENGFYCQEDNSRLKDNQCVIYDIIEAKHY